MLFPVSVRFVPYTILHNVSTHPIVATISMTSEAPNGSPATRTLGKFSLAAGQSQTVDYAKFGGVGQPEPILPDPPIFHGPTPRPEAFATAVKEELRTPLGPGSGPGLPGAMLGGFANISIAYQGLEGDLMADVGSMDQSGNYVFEVSPVAAGPSIGRILCFWELRNNRDTMISVWNYTAAAQDLQLVLLYWGGQYRIPIHLEANKTYNLDMMTLIHSRIPDPDGVLIPSNITTGSAMLFGKGGEADKINVATSGSTFSPLEQDCNIICSNCESYSSITLEPFAPVLPIFGTAQLTATGTLGTGTAFTPENGRWSSANTAIATVTTAGLLTAVAPGSTTLTYTASVPEAGIACGDAQCPWETVNVPEPSNSPEVTFGPLTAVTVNGTVPVLVSYSSGISTNTKPITVTISTKTGTTGSATFPGGATSTTITSLPTTVTITGVTASSTPNNLTLDATVPGGEGSAAMEDATNPQSFSVITVPIPVNFKQKAGSGSSGNLSFTYAWSSSTGSVSDLSNCWIMENVQYVGGSPFVWPSPPYSSTAPTTPNPTRNDGINGDLPLIQGSAGTLPDQQLHPGFQGPYAGAPAVNSTQTFLWECSNLNNGNFTAFPGISYQIVRSISADGSGGFQYTVTKSGVSATVDPLP
jgi:hypothetical protein